METFAIFEIAASYEVSGNLRLNFAMGDEEVPTLNGFRGRALHGLVQKKTEQRPSVLFTTG